jgi:hypothetical protein
MYTITTVVPKRTDATPMPSAKSSESRIITPVDYLTCELEEVTKKSKKAIEPGAGFLEKFKGNLTVI